MINLHLDDEVSFVYVNWRGEKARRYVRVIGFYWGKTDWHPEYQMLLYAYDFDKKKHRYFAVKDMSDVAPL